MDKFKTTKASLIIVACLFVVVLCLFLVALCLFLVSFSLFCVFFVVLYIHAVFDGCFSVTLSSCFIFLCLKKSSQVLFMAPFPDKRFHDI